MACSIKRNESGTITSVLDYKGNDSILFQKLLERNNGKYEQSLQEYLYAYTTQFKSYFGNFEADNSGINSFKLYANGEPRAEYIPALEDRSNSPIIKGINPEYQKMIVDSLVYKFFDAKNKIERSGKEFKVENFLGKGKAPGSLAMSFLRSAYTDEDGGVLDVNLLLDLYAREAAVKAIPENTTERAKAEQEFDDYMDSLETPVYIEFPEKILEEYAGLSEEELEARRELFFNIYNNWDTKVDRYGNSTPGWRELIKNSISSKGLDVIETSYIARDSFNDELEIDLSDDIETTNRLYGKNRLEEDPFKTVPNQMKELLATVPASNKNALGFRTFIPIEDVYAELSTAFADKTSFQGMLVALKNLATYKEQYKDILDFFNKLSRSERAGIVYTFGLSHKKFLATRILDDEDVLIYNPAKTNIERSAAISWREQAVSGEVANPRSLYRRISDPEGNDTLILRDPEAGKRIFDNYKKVAEAAFVETVKIETEANNVISPAVESLARLLWDMSIQYGNSNTLVESMRLLQTYFNEGVITLVKNDETGQLEEGYVKGRALYKALVFPPKDGHGDLKISWLVSSIIDFSTAGSFRPDEYIGAKRNPSNFFITHGKVVQHLASPTKYLNSAKVESFRGASGKSIYPNNLINHLDYIVSTLTGPEGDVLLKEYLQDPFLNPNLVEHRSILLTLLSKSKFKGDFTNHSIDAIDKSELGQIGEYKNLSDADLRALKLNLYLNNGNRNTFYAQVPTQADRDDFSVVPFIRSSRFSEYGLGINRKGVIQSMIIQDFFRIKKAKLDIESIDEANLIDGYHFKGRDAQFNPIILNENGELVGNAFNRGLAQLDMKDAVGDVIFNDEVIGSDPYSLDGTRRLSDVAYDMIHNPSSITDEESKLLNEAVEEMSTKALDYFREESKRIVKLVTPFQDRLSKSGLKAMGGLTQAVNEYVFDDFVARNEIIKLTRGSKAYHKNLVDLYKRMGHLRSPGRILAMQSDLGVNSKLAPSDSYKGKFGMPETLNTVLFEDVKLDLGPLQVARKTVEQAERVEGLLKAKDYLPEGAAWSEAKVQKIIDSYVPGNIEGTDALAIITLDTYRFSQQGKNMWTPQMEEAYWAYKGAPVGAKKFVYLTDDPRMGKKAGEAVPILPQKPYYEDLAVISGSKTPISHKNHWHVLIEEYTKDFPEMDRLRSWMEDNNIHIANFVSGSKLAKNGVKKLSEGLADIESTPVTAIDSRGLRFPQEIPYSKKTDVAFNRQLRKNGITNVYPNHTYVYNAGLDTATPTSGEDLLKLYHGAIEERLRREVANINKSLGVQAYREALESGNEKTFKEAKLKMLQNVRNILNAEIQSRNLPDVYSRALKIVPDEAGNPSFAIDLDFPIYGLKFQHLIMSLFNNNAYKMKMKGSELVQIAQLGGHALTNELKFYSIVDDETTGVRLGHAEVMIKPSVLRNFGIDPGQSLESINEELRRIIAYRIPHQEKLSTVVMKLAGFLPENYEKAILLPAEITKLTGSDFDVDKLFVLFPEVEDKEGVLKKVSVPYNELASGETSLASLSMKQLNNIMLDSIEAIATNPAHILESLAPMDEQTLKSVRELMEAERPELVQSDEFSSSETEIAMMRRNQLGNALRGLWANFNAGASVAQYGNIRLNSKYNVLVDGIAYTETTFSRAGIPASTEVSDPAGYVNEMGSRYLSSAVDAAKEMLQYALNDTKDSFPVRVHLLTSFPDEVFIARFLNTPIIKDLTNIHADRYDSDPRMFYRAFNDVAAKWGIRKLNANGKILSLYKAAAETGTYNLNRDELLNASETPSRDAAARDLNIRLLTNYKLWRDAGQEKTRLFKAITPDSLDGIGTIHNIESYMSKVAAYEKYTDGSVFVGDPATQYLVGDAYGLSRGFYNMFVEAQKTMAEVFPVLGSPAIQRFKSELESAIGKSLTAEQHRDVSKRLQLMMLAFPGSPLADFFSESHIDINYNAEMVAEVFAPDGKTIIESNSILDRIQYAKNRYPAFASNPLINALSIGDGGTSKTPALSIDSNSLITRNDMSLGLYSLMYSGESYASSTEDKAWIESLGEDIAMHLILQNGMLGYNVAEIIPPEFWSRRRTIKYGKRKGELTSESPVEFYRKVARQMSDPQTLLPYIDAFIAYSGTMYSGGQSLLSSKRVKAISPIMSLTDVSPYDNYVKVYSSADKNTYIYKRVDGDNFKLIAPFGNGRNYFEIFTRTAASVNSEERIMQKSAFPFNNRIKNTEPLNLDYTVWESESRSENSNMFNQEQLEVFTTNPKSTSHLMQVVTRLQRNFKRKGINVEVRLDPTIDSVGVLKNENGQLVIYLNPTRATQETVFHEFAHIFIDTLGVNHPLVQELIAEAEKIGVGDIVRALYTQRAIDQGLTEAQVEEKIAKEIAATVVGLEGARVETNKPSKIKQIINRILRAIGKLLGITNSRAAEVAQELWDESFDFGNLVNAFSDYAQESLLREEAKVKKLVDDAKVLLKSYIIRQQSQPNASKDAIQELNRQISLLENIEKFEDFNEFIRYATRITAAAKANFKDIERIYQSEEVQEQEILNGLKKLYHIHSTIDALVDGKTNESILKRLSTELQAEVMRESSNSSRSLLQDAERSLARTLADINYVQSQYIEYGADLYANLLYKIAPPTINMNIKKLINNIEKNQRLIGIKKDKEYERINALKDAGKISSEEAKSQLIELNISQLKTRQTSVSSIKRMLLEEMDDSSGFSALFDPIIFNNDVSIQLHALRLKEGAQKAAESTEEVQTLISNAYQEFLGGKTDLNPAKTNAKLLETTTVEVPIRGTSETTTMEVASFVQPFLTAKYKAEEKKMWKEMDAKYMVDARRIVKDLMDGGYTEKQAWKNEVVRNILSDRRKEVDSWYKENSDPIPQAEAILQDLRKRQDRIASEIDAIINSPAESISLNQKLRALNSELAEVQKEIRRGFSNGQFRGNLAMPNSKYINPKYEALKADPAAFKYYEAMLAVYKQAQSQVMGGSFKLPINSWEDFSYAMPGILESSLDSWLQGKGFTSVKNWVNDTFFMVDTDTDFGELTDLNGEKLKTIPVFFSRPVEATKVSKDIASSMIFFAHMANMYTQKSNLLAEVMIMKDLMSERGVIETTSSGVPIVNRIAEMIGVDKAKKGTTNNRQKQLNDFVDMYFFGERKKSYKARVFGKDVSIGKVTSAIASFTALNTLSLNYMQATNQLIMDNYRLMEEAAAGEFITAKGLLKAKSEYMKHLGAIKDVGKIDPKSPLAKYLRYVDAFQTQEELGGRPSAGAKIKKLPGEVFMGFQSMAEAETAITRAIAVGYNIKVKLADGTTTNLYDAYVDNKDLKGAKQVMSDGSEVDLNRRQVSNILGGIYKRTNQLKGDFNRVAAERIPGLDLVLLFRKFMVPSIRRRFGHGGKESLHIDAELGTVTQGMYISFRNYLLERIRGGIVGGAGTFKRLSDMEKANVKRTMMEAGGALLSLLAYTTLANMDDEEENDTVIFWAYQMRRLQLELTAFNPVSFVTSGELLRLLKSPTAGVRSLSKLQDLFTDLYYYTGYELGFDIEEKDVFYQRSQGKYEKGDLKLEASFDKFVIGRAGLLQSENAREALKWFNQAPI